MILMIGEVCRKGSNASKGTFGQVLECWNRERKDMAAIKIVRGIKKYREAAMIEVEVLQQLGKHDKDGNRCVQIRNWFDYHNHICIVIMHDLHLIHTDLKPENILLVSSEHVKVPDYKGSSRSPKDGSYFKKVPKSSAIKVIDFGSTTYDRQDQSYIVSIRHYRAPEVILGYVIPKGCFVVPFLSAVHLDENLYEGAITFNPWRWMDLLNQVRKEKLEKQSILCSVWRRSLILSRGRVGSLSNCSLSSLLRYYIQFLFRCKLFWSVDPTQGGSDVFLSFSSISEWLSNPNNQTG
ncbi:hypothetical protein HYC85_013059 [Camellia sinensis]|uniref:Protein kinase domain-containing protein n=1 Tax=Camellia sinensis TaxID=4442 RepID=A0A7J7HGR9_CAMSI|nr:hypothetical protein HYC85_013059 [Camellia sinensis]